jgi:hypothetical protein
MPRIRSRRISGQTPNLLPGDYKLAAVAIAHRLEDHRINKREDSRAGPDTERERQKRGQCESRSFQQQTAREAQIFRELLKTVPAPRFTAIFLLKRHVSKLLMNLGTGFFLAHSLLHQVVDLFLDMRGHFGGEIAIHSPSFEPAPYWIHDSEGLSTRPTPTSRRSNPAISRCSCLRPAGVIL